MNLAHLKFVIATAELKSFSRAAERCHVTQSTLSNGVAEVEEELGAKLFERTTRTVNLSPFGKAMVPLINSILSAESNLALQAKNYLNPEKALIKIGVSPLLNPGFTSVLTQSFRDKNPSYEIVLYEENLEHLQKMLVSNNLDFIFVPRVADFGKMKSLCLYDEPLVLITQAPDLLASKSVSPKTLRDEKFVMVPDSCGLARITREIFKKAKVPLNEYEGKAFSYSALTDWAQNGIGSAVLPKSKISKDTKSLPVMDSNSSVERIRFVAIGNTSSYSRFKAFTEHIRNTSGRLSKGLALDQSCMTD
jgi:DNA-binding transcriptional LysR family regulator